MIERLPRWELIGQQSPPRRVNPARLLKQAFSSSTSKKQFPIEFRSSHLVKFYGFDILFLAVVPLF
jgi:hypothetical protein